MASPVTTEIESAFEQGGGRALPAFEHAVVSDVMHSGVITCDPAEPLRMVAATMASKRIHCVVVAARDDGQASGSWSIVSDLDLVNAVTEDRFDDRTAASAAISEFLTVTADEKLHRVAQMMTEHELTHLVVVDRASGRPTGVLSTLDVAAAVGLGGTETPE